MLLDANGNCYFQQSCGRACILCSSTAPNTCIGCVSHATLNSGQCTCNSGYFLDTVNNICRQCYTTCATCTSYTVSGCLTCRDTTRSTLSGGQCICSSGWFMDLSTGLCAPCHSHLPNLQFKCIALWVSNMCRRWGATDRGVMPLPSWYLLEYKYLFLLSVSSDLCNLSWTEYY
jgi:hypothetical protein